MTDGLINGEPTFQGVTFIRSATIGRLMGALARAQGGFVTVRKTNVAKVEPTDGEKRSYTYRYAELADFLEACRKPLSEAGLAVTQPARVQGSQVTVETTLWHESGEWISNVFVLSAATPAPQKVGSALTFARRYSFCALLGLAAEKEDDDGAAAGEGAVERPPRPGPGPKANAPRARPVADLQRLREDVRTWIPELEGELVDAVVGAGGDWAALPEDVGALWSAGWRAVGDRLKAARSRGAREPQAASAPTRAGDAPRRRGPNSLGRLREACAHFGLEGELVDAVVGAGGDWAALPADCTDLWAVAWSAVGERLEKAKAAQAGQQSKNAQEEVAAKVAAVASGMTMPR